MKSISIGFRALAFGIASILLLAGSANAAEVRVMISGGLTAAYQALVPEFEKATGNKVITAYGPSMGTTVNAIPVRLARGEPADVLIMGCAGMAGCRGDLEEAIQIPVVEPTQAAVTMAIGRVREPRSPR